MRMCRLLFVSLCVIGTIVLLSFTSNKPRGHLSDHVRLGNGYNTTGQDTCDQGYRRDHLHKACPWYDWEADLDDPDTYWRLYALHREKFIYCSVPKAGSTTIYLAMSRQARIHWKYQKLFTNKLTTTMNTNKPKPEFLYLRRNLSQTKEMLKKYTTVIQVRHPLARLYSAYVDRIQHRNLHHPEPYFDIVEQYYPGKTSQGFLDLTFTEFLNLIVKEYSTGRFINRHWTLQSDLCMPCQIRYDIIAKLETTDSDIPLIAKAMDGRINQAKKRNVQANMTLHSLQEVYVNISEHILLQLHDLYKKDFDLFGYKLLDDKPC